MFRLLDIKVFQKMWPLRIPVAVSLPRGNRSCQRPLLAKAASPGIIATHLTFASLHVLEISSSRRNTNSLCDDVYPEPKMTGVEVERDIRRSPRSRKESDQKSRKEVGGGSAKV